MISERKCLDDGSLTLTPTQQRECYEAASNMVLGAIGDKSTLKMSMLAQPKASASLFHRLHSSHH